MARLTSLEKCGGLTAKDKVDEVTDVRNTFADAFSKQIDSSLGEEILDGAFGREFPPSYADLYVERRTWKTEGRIPGEKYAHEQWLHQKYWPGIANDSALLIISGKEGVGKSTLLRYYFDCYLPHFDDFPYAKCDEHDSECRRRKLTRHLVFHVDLRRSTDAAETRKQLFRALKKQILMKCHNLGIEITVDNNYAMWDRVVNWSDPLHKRAAKAFPDESTYRANFVDPILRDSEDVFVREAFWYLGKQLDEKEGRRFYITTILDNLDQSSYDVQLYTIRTALSWLEDGPYHWKMILPLRPETLQELSRVLQPIGNYEVFEIGEVDQQLLLQKRSGDLERRIKASGIQVDRNILIKDDNVTVYLPIPTFEGATRMTRMLNFDACLPRGQAVSLRPRAGIQELVKQFCNGSVRRFLRLRKRLIISMPIAHAIERQDRHKDDPLPDYIFLNGVLTGGRDHFHKNDIGNDIVNLYDVVQPNTCSYTMLIGVHVLFLLRTGRAYRRSQLIGLLAQIGYTRSEVEECLEMLHRKSFFTRENIEGVGDYRVFPESNVVEAHVILLTTAAYVDNMAIVTPVEDRFRDDIQHTLSYEVTHFRARTKATLAFLRQIRDDEDHICRWTKDSPRHKMEARVFKRSFGRLGLPSAYRLTALEYKKRLKELKSNPKGLASVMDQREWNRLLNDEILAVDEKDAESPLQALIP